MLRYVVKLVPKDMNPKDEEHYFPMQGEAHVAYNEANDFAVKNIGRVIEFYSETREGPDDPWQRHVVYRVLADPNR